MRDDKRYQTIVFSLSKYQWRCSIEEARANMWKDISSFLQLLAKNEYIAVVYDDDTDIIVVQFEHYDRDGSWGVANPEWITDDELWHIEHFDELMETGCVEEEDDGFEE